MAEPHPAPSVLVVGTGFGCRVQIPALRAAGFHVVRLVGEDGERTWQRAELNDVPHTSTDLDRAITQTGAIAVAIATPPHTHRAVVLTAARHGAMSCARSPSPAMRSRLPKCLRRLSRRASSI